MDKCYVIDKCNVVSVYSDKIKRDSIVYINSSMSEVGT